MHVTQGDKHADGTSCLSETLFFFFETREGAHYIENGVASTDFDEIFAIGTYIARRLHLPVVDKNQLGYSIDGVGCVRRHQVCYYFCVRLFPGGPRVWNTKPCRDTF